MTGWRNQNRKGQRLGAKGDRMRNALMEATAELLATRRPWAIKVSDIAAACNIRGPTFYAYFDSVEAVILALAEQALSDQPDIASLLGEDWSDGKGTAYARRIAELSIQFWQRHRPVLKVVTMLADDGDPAFREANMARLDSVYQVFRARIEAAKAAGLLEPDFNDFLGAYALANQVDRWGYHYTRSRRAGLSHEEIVGTMSRMLEGLMRGLHLMPLPEGKTPAPPGAPSATCVNEPGGA